MSWTNPTSTDQVSGGVPDPYNAVVREMRLVHDALAIMRVSPDGPMPGFAAGQYATLGLGSWEPRIDQSNSSQSAGKAFDRTLIKRPFSASCPMLDPTGNLVICADLDYVEFFVALVLLPDEERLRLAPRLFALRAGSRIYLGPHFHGSYQLATVNPADTILFLATGTGEAPHNAMICELLKRGHRGKILSAVCVRFQKDLAYLQVHRELERRYPNYRYAPLTTREPENVDPTLPGYVGKQYLQDYIRSGQVENDLQSALDPATTQVYVCGNPEMIGLPSLAPPGEPSLPKTGGMIDLLSARGFRLIQPHALGNIHVERYW